MKNTVKGTDRLLMRNLRSQGKSLSQIASITGFHFATVHGYVRDIPPPPQGWNKGGGRVINGKYIGEKKQRQQRAQSRLHAMQATQDR